MRLPKFQRGTIEALRKGGIGVLPTDTLYGIVGSALRPATVRRIYRARKRSPQKPMIILVGAADDVRRFGVMPDPHTKKTLGRVWPGPVSVVLPIDARRRAAIKKFRYLHRGTRALAFRLPAPSGLRALLRRTGPLVAPSANLEGMPPAKTIKNAKKYFGDRVDLYVDAGRCAGRPSTLIAVRDGRTEVLRKGSGRMGRRR